MTLLEWEKKERSLRAQITRHRNLAKEYGSLAGKITCLTHVRFLEGQLQAYRLNKFELVK